MKTVRSKSDRNNVPHYWLDDARKSDEEAEGHRTEAAEDHRNNDESPEDHSRHREGSASLARSSRSSSSGWLAGRMRA